MLMLDFVDGVHTVPIVVAPIYSILISRTYIAGIIIGNIYTGINNYIDLEIS